MLLSLLPGVRMFRTPLAAGVLWLLVAWIVAEPHLPVEVPSSGPLRSLVRLEQYYGAATLGAATLFTAYLLGILLPFHRLSIVPRSRGIGASVQVLGRRRRRWRGLAQPINDTTARDLRRFLWPTATDAVRILLERPTYGWTSTADDWLRPGTKMHTALVREGASHIVDFVADRMLEERETLAIKLRIVGKELMFQAYDARDSEAQFRRGLLAPSTAMIVVLALQIDRTLFALLAIPLVLAVIAQASQQEALSELFQAVIQAEISSTAVVGLRESVAGKDVGSLDDYLFVDDLIAEVLTKLPADFDVWALGGRGRSSGRVSEADTGYEEGKPGSPPSAQAAEARDTQPIPRLPPRQG